MDINSSSDLISVSECARVLAPLRRAAALVPATESGAAPPSPDDLAAFWQSTDLWAQWLDDDLGFRVRAGEAVKRAVAEAARSAADSGAEAAGPSGDDEALCLEVGRALPVLIGLDGFILAGALLARRPETVPAAGHATARRPLPPCETDDEGEARKGGAREEEEEEARGTAAGPLPPSDADGADAIPHTTSLAVMSVIVEATLAALLMGPSSPPTHLVLPVGCSLRRLVMGYLARIPEPHEDEPEPLPDWWVHLRHVGLGEAARLVELAAVSLRAARAAEGLEPGSRRPGGGAGSASSELGSLLSYALHALAFIAKRDIRAPAADSDPSASLASPEVWGPRLSDTALSVLRGTYPGEFLLYDVYALGGPSRLTLLQASGKLSSTTPRRGKARPEADPASPLLLPFSSLAALHSLGDALWALRGLEGDEPHLEGDTQLRAAAAWVLSVGLAARGPAAPPRLAELLTASELQGAIMEAGTHFMKGSGFNKGAATSCPRASSALLLALLMHTWQVAARGPLPPHEARDVCHMAWSYLGCIQQILPAALKEQAELDARPRQSGHGPLSLLREGLVQFLRIDASKGAFFSAEVASRLARAIVCSHPGPEGQATTAAVLAASLLPPPTEGASRQLAAAASPATRALDQAAADLGLSDLGSSWWVVHGDQEDRTRLAMALVEAFAPRWTQLARKLAQASPAEGPAQEENEAETFWGTSGAPALAAAGVRSAAVWMSNDVSAAAKAPGGSRPPKRLPSSLRASLRQSVLVGQAAASFLEASMKVYAAAKAGKEPLGLEDGGQGPSEAAAAADPAQEPGPSRRASEGSDAAPRAAAPAVHDREASAAAAGRSIPPEDLPVLMAGVSAASTNTAVLPGAAARVGPSVNMDGPQALPAASIDDSVSVDCLAADMADSVSRGRRQRQGAPASGKKRKKGAARGVGAAAADGGPSAGEEGFPVTQAVESAALCVCLGRAAAALIAASPGPSEAAARAKALMDAALAAFNASDSRLAALLDQPKGPAPGPPTPAPDHPPTGLRSPTAPSPALPHPAPSHAAAAAPLPPSPPPFVHFDDDLEPDEPDDPCMGSDDDLDFMIRGFDQMQEAMKEDLLGGGPLAGVLGPEGPHVAPATESPPLATRSPSPGAAAAAPRDEQKEGGAPDAGAGPAVAIEGPPPAVGPRPPPPQALDPARWSQATAAVRSLLAAHASLMELAAAALGKARPADPGPAGPSPAAPGRRRVQPLKVSDSPTAQAPRAGRKDPPGAPSLATLAAAAAAMGGFPDDDAGAAAAAAAAGTATDGGNASSDLEEAPARKKSRRRRQRKSKAGGRHPFVDAFWDEGSGDDSDYSDLDDFIVCKPGRDYRNWAHSQSLKRAKRLEEEEREKEMQKGLAT